MIYDFKKDKIAINNDIILLIIPYTITPENMQDHIVKEFEAKTGIKLPKFNYKNQFVQFTTLNNFI